MSERTSLVYLDWAATAPLSASAVEAMSPYFTPGIAGLRYGNGNANSLHDLGRRAFKTLETARRDVARAIDARPDEITFTSGATEADNAALIGIVEGQLQRSSRTFATLQKLAARRPTVIVSSIEHDAVLEATEALKRRGIDVLMVAPDRRGFITPEALQATLAQANQPLLVSVMAVNNETGAIMDIASLAQVAHRVGALFHTDATQALGKMPISVREWNVDALSLSSHKIGGPKGVGALFLKARTPFIAQQLGGGQESNKRSGTQNIAGEVGFAVAAREAAENQRANARTMVDLRDRLYRGLIALPGVESVVDTDGGGYAPHIVTVVVPGIESESAILQLDKRGISASGGSACSSRSLEPSHVLSAMGIDRDKALCMLRFSLGPDTTQFDIDRCVEAMRDILENTWN